MDMCKDMHKDMCHGTHVCGHVDEDVHRCVSLPCLLTPRHRHVYRTRVDMRVDMYIGMYIAICIDICIDVWIGRFRIHMLYPAMCIRAWTCASTCVWTCGGHCDKVGPGKLPDPSNSIKIEIRLATG